jgi:NitT/TauT family transport system substrate-binding protein
VRAKRGLAVTVLCLLLGHPLLAAETVKVQFDWLPSGEKAPFYLGVEKGLFAAEGLDVVILPGRGTADALAKLGAGVADVGTGGLSTLLSAKADGQLPVTAIMPIFTKQPDAVATVSRTNIASLKDLVGKRVASAPFSSSTPMWPAILKANGIDPASVKLQKVDPVALPAMLAEGRVDAVMAWVNEVPRYQAVLDGVGLKLVMLPWSDFGFDGYGLTLFASDKFLKERPETARKFVRAYLKALRMSQADPNAAAAATHSAVHEVDLDVALGEWQATSALVFNEVTQKDGLGVFDRVRLADTWLWVAKSEGLDPKMLNPETAVDRSFLPAN